MGKTIDDVADDLEKLRAALLDGTHSTKTSLRRIPDPEDDTKEVQGKPVTTLVSDFKNALIAVHPRIVTEEILEKHLPMGFIGKFEEMYKELHKEVSSELFEAFGLDGVGAAVEKLHEGHEDKWKYVGWAIAGIFVPLAIGALVIVFRRVILEGFRALQIAMTGKAYVTKENQKGFERLTKGEIQERERNAGGGMASIPETANFDGLRTQLEKLNPELRTFNTQAPDFKSNLRKIPSVSQAEKAATAVKKIADAVATVDHERMPLVSSGMGKINGAVRNSDPKKTKKFADAVGKLKLAMDGLDVDKVPKVATFQNAANAAKDLAQHTGTLSGRMRAFAEAVRDLNSEMGGGAPASA
ncbi:hypothetical protein [Streptomyces sp. NPDC058326]|uniref:hypothetical protein n=1 Tax=Streptomyces sp. NPDC058326 TaxID=3346447 RepID=UPI0036EDB419